jgi:Right handed beta helix region
VSTSGSDSNPGTITQPWRTVQKAFNTLRAGETALVRGGVYTQSVVMTRAGTALAPITVKSYPGEQAIIHAGGSGSMDYPVRITAGAAYFRLQGFIIEDAPLDTTVNVYISDGQQPPPAGAHDIELRDNEIRDGMGTGVLVAPWTYRVHLIGNAVHHNGIGTAHQHQGVYFQGQDGLIANNAVYDQPNGFGVQVRGEDTEIAANNVIVAENTSVGNSLAGFVVENTASNIKLINNVSAFNGTYGIHGYYCCGPILPGNVGYNNVLYGNASGATRNTTGVIVDFSGGNVLADPRFRNRAAADFRLQEGSAAIDGALFGFAPGFDRDELARPRGPAPDVGAHEY